MENVDGAAGWTTVPVMYAPPISVPPQYSMTGLYNARDMRKNMSWGLEHSPVELKARMPDQSSPSRQPVLRHAETRLGTRPSNVTPAS